jgi:hypothetical protein
LAKRERERERTPFSLKSCRCRVQFRVLNSQFHHQQNFWCSIEIDLLFVCFGAEQVPIPLSLDFVLVDR